ncbi:recombinase family protein [Dactylosporangium sp. NBC_01737]|uniref:recombinase family protein n=1 Tax=Dactylosporangium sp. NBC_01737 TaxID=2975959 RepID=UPI002E112C75|nr:recombinase family protein [Dactylosporangium sp. NBC_01737]
MNALGLVRLSDLREVDLNEAGLGRGLVDQEQRVRDHGTQLGWNVTRVIVENDVASADGKVRGVSAFKRRKVKLPDGRSEWRTFRPAFRESLALLASGAHDGLLALDLDRVVRDPRDLEDLIDLAEQFKIPVESVTGSLRLATDADITMARVMVAMANKSSRDTARRVAAARERQAMTGRYGGGRRPYGFEEDGRTIRPSEAAIIAESSQRLVQGASLRSIALDLRRRKSVTVAGAPWRAEGLREVLLRARNAGRIVYRGEEIGDAPWAPIVPLELFRAVQRILTEPGRVINPGAAPKWLGSRLYLCGICTREDLSVRTTCHVRVGARVPAYRCGEYAHLVRSVKHTDEYVVGAVLARLAREDAADLVAPANPEVDVAALRAEAKAIRENLNELAADKALGLIDRGQLLAATTKGKERQAEIESQLQAAVVDSPLSPLIGADDVKAVWDGLPLSHQRLVVKELMTVRILPSGRKGRGFDPSTVEITWRQTHHHQGTSNVYRSEGIPS